MLGLVHTASVRNLLPEVMEAPISMGHKGIVSMVAVQGRWKWKAPGPAWGQAPHGDLTLPIPLQLPRNRPPVPLFKTGSSV